MIKTFTYSDYCQAQGFSGQATPNEVIAEFRKLTFADDATIHSKLMEHNPALIEDDLFGACLLLDEDFTAVSRLLFAATRETAAA